MLSITGIAARALVIWKVRTMPRRAIAYGGLRMIGCSWKRTRPASPR
jgi:hypothetical protein